VVSRPVTREVTKKNFCPLLEEFVGHSLKILDIVQNIWAPLGKLFAPTGVPSWLRAWWSPLEKFTNNLLYRSDIMNVS